MTASSFHEYIGVSEADIKRVDLIINYDCYVVTLWNRRKIVVSGLGMERYKRTGEGWSKQSESSVRWIIRRVRVPMVERMEQLVFGDVLEDFISWSLYWASRDSSVR